MADNDLIEQYKEAKARADHAANPVAKDRLRHIRQQLRALMDKKHELSSVAKWCVRFRNDRQLLHLLT